MGVTLPPACTRLLGVRRGGTVQVVPLPSGKVVIAPINVRVGRAKELVSAVKELAVMRSRVLRLQRRLAARPLRVFNEGVAQGWAQSNTARFHDLDRLIAQLRVLLAGIDVAAEAGAVPPAPPSPRSPDS